MNMFRNRSHTLGGPAAFTLFCIITILTLSLYSLAFSAPWFYDDLANFRGLEDVGDWKSALSFVFSGESSSIGRPLSNLFFLLNFADVPGNPEGMRYTGTLMHLINGFLLAWAGLRIARLVPSLQRNANFFAFSLAAVWLVHPLQFSATLMPVQRMTVISGTFVLIGIIVYVVGRQRIAEGKVTLGIVLCSLGVSCGAVIGALAKENAALLPFLIAILELTVLKKLPLQISRRLWRCWFAVFVALPFVLLMIYIYLKWPGMMRVYETRPFSLDERLGAQTIIMLEYLRQIFVPNVINFGPFQDDYYGRSLTDVSVVIAVIAWCGLFAISILLRHRTLIPLFALCWFWVGHLLESTVFPLELYFEHRNYIPSIGPLAAVVGVSAANRSFKSVVVVLIFVNAFVLWRVSDGWKDPFLAAEIQAIHREESTRAALFLADAYLSMGQPEVSLRVLRRISERKFNDPAILGVRLTLACRLGESEEIDEAMEALEAAALKLRPNYTIRESLSKVLQSIDEGGCDGLKFPRLHALTGLLLQSRSFQANSQAMHDLHYIRGIILARSGNLVESVAEFRHAYRAGRAPQTAIQIATLLGGLGQYEEARRFLEQEIDENDQRRGASSRIEREQMILKRLQLCIDGNLNC